MQMESNGEEIVIERTGIWLGSTSLNLASHMQAKMDEFLTYDTSEALSIQLPARPSI
jgi:hypothetical protein